MSEEFQTLDGIPVLGPTLNLAIRPHSRWTEFVQSLQDRTTRTLATAFDPTEVTNVVDGSGKERMGAFVLLVESEYADTDWMNTSSGLSVLGRQAFWKPAWSAVHPILKYPFDLTYLPHVFAAMDVMHRYLSWSASERAEKVGNLRGDIAAFTNAERVREANEGRDEMRDVFKKMHNAAKDAFGSISGVDAVKAAAAKIEHLPELQAARAAYRVAPNRKNTFRLEAARKKTMTTKPSKRASGG